MFPYFESIRYCDGVYERLNYHQTRIEKTMLDQFGPDVKPFELNRVLPRLNLKGVYKVRVSYGPTGQNIEYAAYRPKSIERIEIIKNDKLEYRYKSTNRKQLDLPKPVGVEHLFVVRGQITDCSYANIAFKKKDQWFTSDSPLLAGTRRAHLLETGRLVIVPISIAEASKFDQISLINSMLDLGELTLPIEAIKT